MSESDDPLTLHTLLVGLGLDPDRPAEDTMRAIGQRMAQRDLLFASLGLPSNITSDELESATAILRDLLADSAALTMDPYADDGFGPGADGPHSSFEIRGPSHLVEKAFAALNSLRVEPPPPRDPLSALTNALSSLNPRDPATFQTHRAGEIHVTWNPEELCASVNTYDEEEEPVIVSTTRLRRVLPEDPSDDPSLH